MSRYILTVLCLLAFFSLSSPAQAANRALLIGVGIYQNIGSLDGIDVDLRNMKTLLLALGWKEEEIIIIQSSGRGPRQPTGDYIRKLVRKHLINGTRKGDLALLYFSGHGTTVWDADGDERDGPDVALVPFDVVLDAEGKPERDKLILDDEVYSWIKEIRADLYLLVDACSSETITRGKSSDQLEFWHGGELYTSKLFKYNGMPQLFSREGTRGIFESAPKGNYAGISAAKDGQVALASKKGSLMTNFFCTAAYELLDDKNYKQLTLNNLYQEAMKGMLRKSLSIGARQEPFLAIGNPILANESLCLSGASFQGVNYPRRLTSDTEYVGKNVSLKPLDIFRNITRRAETELDARAESLVVSLNENVFINVKTENSGYLNYFCLTPKDDFVIADTPTPSMPEFRIGKGDEFIEPGTFRPRQAFKAKGEYYFFLAVTAEAIMGKTDIETLRKLNEPGRRILSAKTIRIQVR